MPKYNNLKLKIINNGKRVLNKYSNQRILQYKTELLEIKCKD